MLASGANRTEQQQGTVSNMQASSLFAPLMGALIGGVLIAATAIWGARHALLARARQRARQARKDSIEAASAHYHRRLRARTLALQKQHDEDEAALANQAAELDRHAQQLATRSGYLQHRQHDLDRMQAALQSRRERVETLKQDAVDCGEKLAHARRELVQSLERTAGASAPSIRAERVEALCENSQLESQRQAREAEEKLRSTLAERSRATLDVAMMRYNGVGHLERAQNTVWIREAALFEALADPQTAAHAAFFDTVGCALVGNAEQQSLTVRGEDPLAREVARRTLEALQSNTNASADADTVRQLGEQARDAVAAETDAAAAEATQVLGLAPLPAPVHDLVGRLKFRLSFSQNQWRHSIEVGYLAGIVADEMGLNRDLARRGGLLHDIGKAMTHAHDGAHAVLGANVARECGEPEPVANAIGAHHNDEPPTSAYAHIVTAADAISGARPGARRESVTHYMKMLEDIQRVACRSDAVQRVDIMQAGREVRVLVGDAEQGDATPRGRGQRAARESSKLPEMAAEIARAIEKEVTYAGQIRITVIQQSRAVSVAR